MEEEEEVKEDKMEETVRDDKEEGREDEMEEEEMEEEVRDDIEKVEVRRRMRWRRRKIVSRRSIR